MRQRLRLGKRLFDCVCATALALIILPWIGWIAFNIWRQGDGPILYRAERMSGLGRSFTLYKFRTMRVACEDDIGVTGGDKLGRVTEYGAKLRRRHLDELPQLWNVIRGDISFVGPRPPLREFTERFPVLYEQVLWDKPGVTGLATLIYNNTEEKLLAQCVTSEETDKVYCKRCIPAKARLDLFYQRRASFALDLWIIGTTLHQIFSKDPGCRHVQKRKSSARSPVPLLTSN
ncbi:MAG: sugar transferase [Pseudomonadota bacterium]